MTHAYHAGGNQLRAEVSPGHGHVILTDNSFMILEWSLQARSIPTGLNHIP